MRIPGAGRRPAFLGLTARVFIGIAGIVLVVIVAASALSMAALRRASDAGARRAVEQAADLAAQSLAGRSRSLAGGARVFVQSPYFHTLVAQRRRDDVLDQAFEAAEQLEADWVFITDERGILIAKSDEPGAGGVPMGDVPLVAGALRGHTTSGFGESHDSVLFQAVGVPIAAPGSAPIGVLVATRVVSAALARDMKSTTNSDIVFYARDQQGRRHVAATTLAGAAAPFDSLVGMVNRVVDATQASLNRGPVRIGPDEFLAQGASLTTFGGETVGGFVILRAREGEFAGFAGVRRSLLVASAIGIVLALAGAYAAARYITRPVHALATRVRRAAEGDYAVEGRERLALDGGPEISALADAVELLLVDLRGKDALMHVAPLLSADVAGSAVASTHGIVLDEVASARGSGGSRRSRSIARSDLGLENGAVLASRYAIEALVGSGGLGIVYRARDLVIDEIVALKLLRPELAAAEAGALERLKHELRVARRISHRNVVRTHDIGESDGIPFLTMEYVDGAALSTIVRARGALPLAAVLSIAQQLMRALAVTVEQGIVHGDLKPANLLVGPSGVLKVSDFGVARFIRRTPSVSPSANASLAHLGGAVVGTPEYMAPEQLLGEPATARSDIYSAGIVLQECLVGTVPHAADTPMAFIANKLDAPARGRRLLDAVTETSDLHRLVASMLEPDPERRPGSAALLYERFARMG